MKAVRFMKRDTERVPVADANGNIVMQKKYVLGDMFKGNHADIIGGLASSYVNFVKMLGEDQEGRLDTGLTGSSRGTGYNFADAVDTVVNDGITVSFVHTHPYCTYHIPNEFSGELGKTPKDFHMDDHGPHLNIILTCLGYRRVSKC